jgi:recombination protein RecA
MPRKSKVAEAIADAASDVAKKTKKRRTEIKEAARVKLGAMFKPMSKADSNVTEGVPTSLEVLDRYVLGCGGWPVKRVVELYGDAGSGKTSFTFAALAGAQRRGGLAILIETENSLQVARARIFGCDLESVYLDEPASFEDVIEGMREGLSNIPEGMGPNVLAWDSLAMSTLQDIIDRGLASKSVGKKAKHMSEQLPAVARLARVKRTAFLIVNQTRQKIGVVFGNPTTTPGGEAHKFSASVRLQLWAGTQIKSGNDVIGNYVTVRAMKNKVGMPHRKTKVRLLYETGWDDHWSTLNHAKDMGVVDKGLKLTEANYIKAREALGWPGEGTPFTQAPIEGQSAASVVEDDEDEYR